MHTVKLLMVYRSTKPMNFPKSNLGKMNLLECQLTRKIKGRWGAEYSGGSHGWTRPWNRAPLELMVYWNILLHINKYFCIFLCIFFLDLTYAWKHQSLLQQLRHLSSGNWNTTVMIQWYKWMLITMDLKSWKLACILSTFRWPVQMIPLLRIHSVFNWRQIPAKSLSAFSKGVDASRASILMGRPYFLKNEVNLHLEINAGLTHIDCILTYWGFFKIWVPTSVNLTQLVCIWNCCW